MTSGGEREEEPFFRLCDKIFWYIFNVMIVKMDTDRCLRAEFSRPRVSPYDGYLGRGYRSRGALLIVVELALSQHSFLQTKL